MSSGARQISSSDRACRRDGAVPPLLSRLLLALVLLTALQGCTRDAPPQLSAQQLDGIAQQLESLMQGLQPAQVASVPRVRDVYLALYLDGRRIAAAWGAGSDFDLALAQAASAVVAANPRPQWDYAELSLAHGFRRLDASDLGDDLTATHRGVRGLSVQYQGREVRYAPTRMIADNLSFERALSRAAAQLQLSGEELIAQARLHTFESLQVIVRKGSGVSELFRGNHFVEPGQVDAISVNDFSLSMQGWMWRNLHDNGRMTYLLYPSSGRESTGNNMIRQWMASLCLTRMAVASGRETDLERAAQNIRYNLDRFYLQEGELGLIEYRDKVKLGAVSLAALAILEHPYRQRFEKELQALVATTDALWRDDGSFQTFYRPAARSAEPNLHNFYPGETLLLWATLLNHRYDAGRERRFMQSFRYYRDWHLANRKPAFIPWHTQAYFLRWQRTGDSELRDWIFTMNDWLLGMQTDSRLAYDDTLGRFYDPHPARRHFGPPHASSTGVYLEGLIDAYHLALEERDTARIAKYGNAIRLGLRSAMQLQLQDDETLWFAPRRDLAAGGLRTTVYNNVVRVDNVQHTLMAVMKMQSFADGVEPELAAALPGYELLLSPNGP